jgi:radical SAM superfamily enzyme YgiQ (UPF0313 family)
MCPEESFNFLSPDYMIVGECDEIIRELIKNAENGQAFISEGVWNKNEAKQPTQKVSANPHNFNWSWELHNKYSIGLNKNIVNYVNTRSCPFNCHFCGIVKTKYQEMPPEKVVEQISDLCGTNKSVWVHWETPCCFYDLDIAKKILEGIKELNIHFAGQHRVEEPTPAIRNIYKLAADAGLDNLFVGIESMQDGVLNKMNKGNKSHLVEPCLKALTDVGITINSGWIIGIPGQTADDVRRDMDEAVKLIQKGIMAVALPQYLEIYPGTWFWNNAEKLGITLYCDVNSYDLISRTVAHRTNELSREDIWSLYNEFLDAVRSVL